MKATGLPTLKTVAEEAGVSVATASYVLHGRAGQPTRISPLTQELVAAAAEKLGYKRNNAASSMRTGRSNEIYLALGDWDTPWTQAVMAQASLDASANGLSALAVLTPDWFNFFRGRSSDGIIIAAGDGGGDRQRELGQLAARGHHILAHGSNIAPDGFDVIRQDYTAAIAEAMDLLTSRHRRIGIMCSTHEEFMLRSSSRVQGYVDGLTRAGLGEDLALVGEARGSANLAFGQALRLLQLPDRPTALYCTSDLAAMAAVWAADRLGLRVPEDLEIIGTGNSPAGAGMDPALTTIGPPPVFHTMLALVLARMKGEGDPEGLLVPSVATLQRRGTTLP